MLLSPRIKWTDHFQALNMQFPVELRTGSSSLLCPILPIPRNPLAVKDKVADSGGSSTGGKSTNSPVRTKRPPGTKLY